MPTYLLKRLLLMIPMMIGISLISFFVMQLAPGNAGGERAGEGRSTKITKQQREVMDRAFHLNQPIHMRYFYWVGLVQDEPTADDLKKAERRALNMRLFKTEDADREPTPEEIAANPIPENEKRAYVPKTGIIHGDFGNSMQFHSKKSGTW